MIENYILMDPSDEELAVSHQRMLCVYNENDQLCYFFSDQVTACLNDSHLQSPQPCSEMAEG